MVKENRKFDLVGGMLIPLSYLIVVLLLDAVTTRSTITPLFGIIGLLVLSFSLTPGVMNFWAAVYSLIVVVIFMNPILFHLLNREAPPGDDLTPLVRSATFLVGAIIATLFCRGQYRLKQSNSGLTHILEKLPIPVITADQDGIIHFANAAASVIAGIPSDKLRGHSFFDIFADKNLQGATIANYLRRFSSHYIEQPLLLKCHGRDYLGATEVLETSNPRVLMIVVTNTDSSESVKRSD
jgi:PAS domain S-box-containing protein